MNIFVAINEPIFQQKIITLLLTFLRFWKSASIQSGIPTHPFRIHTRRIRQKVKNLQKKRKTIPNELGISRWYLDKKFFCWFY